MNEDIWREDARTDRAIELLNLLGAKTDADGNVVPRHRYSRNFERVANHLRDLAWNSDREDVRIVQERDPDTRTSTVTVTVRVVVKGEEWEQQGVVTSDEGAFDWPALAACRALLHYTHDDGTPMTPDEVIAMLENNRAEFMARDQRA